MSLVPEKNAVREETVIAKTTSLSLVITCLQAEISIFLYKNWHITLVQVKQQQNALAITSPVNSSKF